MADVALLNPQVESEICKRMIDAAMVRQQKIHQALTTSVLDRETYLLKIGAASELDRLLQEMQQMYDREFRV